MRKRIIFLVCLGSLFLLVATCRKAETADGAGTEKTTKGEKADGAEATAPDEKALLAAIGEKWHVRFEGMDLPEAGGTIVKQFEFPGPLTHYTLLSDDQKVDLDLKGVKPDQTGTFSAYSLQIAYYDENIVCGASEIDRGTDASVVIERNDSGIRVTIDGTVRCAHVQGNETSSSKPAQKATVHAWFVN